MEKKTFRIIKNMLWPVKSTIEIGPEGIANNGKLIKWADMKAFSCSVESINRAMNYSIVCESNSGKSISLHFIVTIAGNKKKKQMFAEIYEMALEGFTTYLIEPKSQQLHEEIQQGKELTVAGASVSQKGVEITKGMIKKEKVFIPLNEIMLQFPPGTGGFRIMSTLDKKDFQHFMFQGTETRYLLALLQKMLPEKASTVYTAPDVVSE